MKILKLEGLEWKVEADHTHALIFSKFKKKGIVETELIEREGTPEELIKFMEGKKCRILHAWNIKHLSWEVLLKDGITKHRRTKTIQAEGIDGQGRKYTEDNKELPDNPENTLVDSQTDKLKRNVAEFGKTAWLKTYLLITALVALVITLVVSAIKYIKRW